MKSKALIVSTVVAVLLGAFSLRKLTAQPGRDYLSPELRAQVNQLKRDAETQPTNARNVAARGVLLWQWVNAYALTGGHLPVNATQELGAAFVLDDAAKQGTPPATNVNVNALIRNVNALIYEFRLRDERPRLSP